VTVRVVCAQLDPVLLDLPGNLARAADAVATAVGRGADIVVLPELVTSGYLLDSTDEAMSVAITPDDARLAAWRAPLRGTGSLVVGGICERGEDGRLYNSAVLLDAGGVVAVYRKTHLWNREKRFFTPGAEPAPVLDTAFGRIGILVCYDLEFPEVPRTLALAGADLLLAPTNWSELPRPAGEQPPQVLNARMAARANHVFVAVCDRTGTERGQRWTGGTAVIDPEGWVLALPDEDGYAIADLVVESARNRQTSTVNHVLGDRRPDLYRL